MDLIQNIFKDTCPFGFKCFNNNGDYECHDIDECSLADTCGNNEYCINKLGGYSCHVIDPCINYTGCATGTECISAGSDGAISCRDINECDLSSDLCPGPGQICENTIGSYNCLMIDLCATLPCDEGFDCVMNNTSEVGYNCYDIDECEIESICEPGFECVNSMGTFSCIEINECLEKPNPCPHGQSCLNSIGSYS